MPSANTAYRISNVTSVLMGDVGVGDRHAACIRRAGWTGIGATRTEEMDRTLPGRSSGAGDRSDLDAGGSDSNTERRGGANVRAENRDHMH